jgi:hypothetical protein
MTKDQIIKKVRVFVLGERAKGEPAYDKKPTFRTICPNDRIDEFEWYKQLRVSCLYKKN